MQIYYALMFGIIVTGFLFVANVSDADEKAELEKSPRHGEWVKVTAANDRVINAFVVYPEVKTPATSIIVIHEIFGLTDWIRVVADRLAADGFVAICPDLLSGMGPDGGGTESFGSGDDVRRAIRELPASQVTSDLNAVEKYVRDLPST
ncbi:dienelactone hydrolase family protein, partial [Candidatus Poribacteria bacterium]|nr:dienelactone hydrolase family protein [Candidatus Poribacteria bacterium]